MFEDKEKVKTAPGMLLLAQFAAHAAVCTHHRVTESGAFQLCQELHAQLEQAHHLDFTIVEKLRDVHLLAPKLTRCFECPSSEAEYWDDYVLVCVLHNGNHSTLAQRRIGNNITFFL